jgi:DNA-binding SARP family transcriptional activator
MFDSQGQRMLEIRMFGPVQVGDSDRMVDSADFHGIKPRQVLHLLALHHRHPVPKHELAELLWEGRPPSSWGSTLEGYVSLLRQALQPGVSARDSVVLTRNGGYLLDQARVLIDVARFDTLTALAGTLPVTRALPALDEALELVRGDVLAYERRTLWATDARGRYRQRLRRAAVQAARLALAAHDPDAVIRYAQRACEAQPLAEDAWQLLIEGHWRAGARADALRCVAELRGRLDTELGISPSHAVERLQLAILRDQVPVVA